MANVRDCDTSLWLHNKLGTSNDSWTSGSICSQLTKEVLRNIKDCFPDLQTQVKLKLLLSFFHIPRRLVEEWKSELEEIIELAAFDSELWVSMIAETIKTFPRTGSLNTEISDYEETRPIFTDMVNDLRRLIGKHSDIGMLPLECQYLNKAALVSVVGQQAPPVKHFTIKKKPKSYALKAELLKKCADAQSQVKKCQAPTIPLRTRGMPRKMTDTTPLKGIPSRVPTGGGFRGGNASALGSGAGASGSGGGAGAGASGSATMSGGSGGTPGSGSRPNLSRTPAGRKDGGIKLLDIAEQPLGYAALKKRKRQQELEDQQKRALEAQTTAASAAAAAAAATAVATASVTAKSESMHDEGGSLATEADGTAANAAAAVPVTTTTPDYAAGLNATSIYTQPATPAVSTMTNNNTSGGGLMTSSSIKDSQLLTIDTPVIIAGLESPMHSPDGLDHGHEQQLEQQLPQLSATTTSSSAPSMPAIIKFVKAEPTTPIKSSDQLITIKSEAPATQPATPQIAQIVQVKSEPSSGGIKSVVLPVPQMMSLPTLGGPSKVTQKQRAAAAAAAAASVSANNNTINSTASFGNSSTNSTTNNKSQIVYMKSPPTIVSVATAGGQRLVTSTAGTAAAGPTTQTTTTTTTTNKTPQRVVKQRQQIVQQSPAASAANTAGTAPKQPTLLQVPTSLTTQYITAPKLTAIGGNKPSLVQPTPKKQKINIQSNIQIGTSTAMPGLTALSLGNNSNMVVQHIQAAPQLQQLQIPSQIGSTKIVQIKSAQNAAQTIQLQQQSQQPQLQRIIVSGGGGGGGGTGGGHQQQNIPPLIATQQPTILNIRNVSIAGRQQQQITTSNQQQPSMQTTSSASNISYITNAQSQPAQQQTQRIQIQQQQPIQLQQSVGMQKFNQVLMGPAGGKGNTIILSSNPHQQMQTQQPQQQQQQPQQQQKTIILRSMGPDGKAIYQQVPLSSLAGMNIATANPPGLIKTQPQQIQIQQQQQQVQQLPALVPTSQYAQTLQNMPVVLQSSGGNAVGGMPQLIMNSDQPTQTIHIQQQPQQQQQQQQGMTTTLPGNTIIRPVMLTNQQGGALQMLPQGLTLIQRPGQQPQLVQTIQQQPAGQQQQQQQHRTIITQQQQQQQPQQHIQIRQQPQQIIIQQQQPQNNNLTFQQKQPQQTQQIQIHQQQQQPQIVVKQQAVNVQQQQRTLPANATAAGATAAAANATAAAPIGQTPKSIKISTENISKAQEMFRRANKLTRRDKALILSFMAGCRENPLPSAENSIVIKLSDAEEKVKLQGAADSTACLRHVEAFIKLDYNTGKWSRFENYRSIDDRPIGGGGGTAATATATTTTTTVGGTPAKQVVRQAQAQ